MKALPPALIPLAAYDQFITWRGISRPNGKTDKLPLNWETGAVANAHEEWLWTNAGVAMAVQPDDGGVGFVFTRADPFWFIDLDHCIDAGTWSPLAQTLYRRLGAAACEVSQSGTGLHWFGTYIGDEPLHACKNVPLGLELYTSDRFVALTGRETTGSADADCTEALASVIAEYFPPKGAAKAGGTTAEWTTEPVAEWGGPTDDNELVRRMLAGDRRDPGSVFGGTPARLPTRALWEADANALALEWPPTGAGDYDASSADMALANHLAFWTGKNCERMEALMRRSALAREKWDAHRTYLQDTVLHACAFVSRVALATPPHKAGREERSAAPNITGWRSLADLQEKVFPALEWVIPGFLPQGLTLLAGRPKLGKSWLALDFAGAVASGGRTLDVCCEAGDVLYAALEDNERRLKDRAEKLFSGKWPS